jgi:hypothetical protein
LIDRVAGGNEAQCISLFKTTVEPARTELKKVRDIAPSVPTSGRRTG